MPDNARVAEAERGSRVLTHRWVPTGLLLALPVALTAVTIVLTVRTGHTISAFTLLPSTATIGVVGAPCWPGCGHGMPVAG